MQICRGRDREKESQMQMLCILLNMYMLSTRCESHLSYNIITHYEHDDTALHTVCNCV